MSCKEKYSFLSMMMMMMMMSGREKRHVEELENPSLKYEHSLMLRVRERH